MSTLLRGLCLFYLQSVPVSLRWLCHVPPGRARSSLTPPMPTVQACQGGAAQASSFGFYSMRKLSGHFKGLSLKPQTPDSPPLLTAPFLVPALITPTPQPLHPFSWLTMIILSPYSFPDQVGSMSSPGNQRPKIQVPALP